MTDWAPILRKIGRHGDPLVISGLAASMGHVVALAHLTTKQRIWMFLGQAAEESAGFKTTTEYASGAEYEGRKDLGNITKGDGVRFKGRGVFQITGRANYMTYGHKLGVDFVDNPALAAEFPYAAETAALYWADHGLNALADLNSIEGITRRINGGLNGLADRKIYTARAKAAL